MRTALFVVAAIALAGCQSTKAPPQEDFASLSLCQKAIRLAGDPWATPAQQLAAVELARNNGCLGQPQTQSLDVTVRQAQ